MKDSTRVVISIFSALPNEERSFKVDQVVQDVVKAKQRNRLLEDSAELISNLANELFKDDLLHINRYEQVLQLIRYAEAVIATFVRPVFELMRLSQNIGIFHEETGDLNKAMESLNLQLLGQEPENTGFKNGLAISYSKLGQTHSSLGNLQQALEFFENQKDSM